MKSDIKRILLLCLVFVLFCGFLYGCQGEPKGSNTNVNIEGVTPVKTANIQRAAQEYSKYINTLSSFPITFSYDTKKYNGFDSDFKEVSRTTKEQEDRSATEIVLSHKDGLLGVRIQTVFYPAYGAYDWTVYFENLSDSQNTAQLVKPTANITFAGEDPIVKGINGDSGALYAPYEAYLCDGALEKVSANGRPTHGVFPYFNLEHGEGGTFIAIGWSGRWEAKFKQTGDTEAVFTGGLYTLDTYLKPGETVRTPLMAFVCYEGRDEYEAMNLWRQWFINCNMRQIDGELFDPVLSGSTSMIYSEMTQATDTNQIRAIEKYVKNDIPITYWWMDAGWYTGPAGSALTQGWATTGAWTVDTERFPSKFKDISDYANANGVKTMLWFEPEIVRGDLELMKQEGVKDEWYLGEATGLTGQLFDLGNSEARAWLVERVAGVLRDGGISLYRQDYNADPANAWNLSDEEGRTGYIENRYVQGYLAYWDALIELFPDMMLDSCASGGGRNDLETMRRSIPVHKSDYEYSAYDIKQSMHMSLFQWLPYFGTPIVGWTSTLDVDMYGARSGYCAWLGLFYNVTNVKLDWAAIKQIANEWTYVKDFYYADYYPLTKWSNTEKDWRGWEFFDEDLNKGYLQFFRPAGNKDAEGTYKLYGLDPNVTYKLTDVDGRCSTQATGKDLMETGFKVLLPEARTSALIYIEAIN
ncbi:MAG: hypothetical protein E7385_05555 [Ruminococcaceae bacterium]|nr:hypothetical protein [Oscillospiraceae bacterium]